MQNGEEGFNYARYAGAVEEALNRLAAKNGAVDTRQIQLETSVPKDLIIEVLDRGMVDFPERIDEIVDSEEGKEWKR
ncbi:MAG: hypothetical protein V5A87_02670 [Candidatus Bipolaricaulota bacterium]|nr:hypothetical protein [Candidatus Bipolaricaulota bacterium]MBS3791700.1 hypothetical protein [Candidatus Bipolaricaulota bacterium]